MRVWLATVGLLLVLISIYQWIQGFILPLPLNVLGGAFLAIASNYEKGLASLIKSGNVGSKRLDFKGTEESEVI